MCQATPSPTRRLRGERLADVDEVAVHGFGHVAAGIERVNDAAMEKTRREVRPESAPPDAPVDTNLLPSALMWVEPEMFRTIVLSGRSKLVTRILGAPVPTIPIAEGRAYLVAR